MNTFQTTMPRANLRCPADLPDSPPDDPRSDAIEFYMHDLSTDLEWVGDYPGTDFIISTDTKTAEVLDALVDLWRLMERKGDWKPCDEARARDIYRLVREWKTARRNAIEDEAVRLADAPVEYDA